MTSDQMRQEQEVSSAGSAPRDTLTVAGTEAQAKRYLEESRRRAQEIAAERTRDLSKLTESLISQAGTVKQQSEDADAERRVPAGARLLATQPAVAGSSCEDIEARLRSEYEIENAGPALDAILDTEA